MSTIRGAEEDLRIYPRGDIPRWMRDEMSRDESVERVDSMAESNAVESLVARYSKFERTAISGDKSSVILSELIEDEGEWFETRTIQKFRNGRVELAAGFARTDSTYLYEDPIDSFDDFLQSKGASAVEISSGVFQQEWLESGGW